MAKMEPGNHHRAPRLFATSPWNPCEFVQIPSGDFRVVLMKCFLCALYGSDCDRGTQRKGGRSVRWASSTAFGAKCILMCRELMTIRREPNSN